MLETTLPSSKLTRGSSFFQMMYSVLHASAPEVFPAKDRGTGNGLTATAARLFGVMVSHSEEGINLCSVAKLLTHLSSHIYRRP